MSQMRPWSRMLCLCLFVTVFLLLDSRQLAQAIPTFRIQPPKPPKATTADVMLMTATIDRHIAAQWVAYGVEPVAPADDAEYMRRVYLDIAGKIPPAAEVRAFLEDRSPDKRRKLVERLLDSPNYVNHFANVWRSQWLPGNNANQLTAYYAPYFEAWLKQRLSENARYDQLVREILDAPDASDASAQQRLAVNQQFGPNFIFNQANESKPENLAASVTRLFLGVKLECAQCHDHPFADWKQEQFWSFAAFFTNTQGQRQEGFTGALQRAFARRGLTIPGTNKVVKAQFLDEEVPDWGRGKSAGAIVADWMTQSNNPYFSKALANRLWSHFFGMGIVDPVDDLTGIDDPSHPKLLDELARELAAKGFDVKYLIRAITASRAYQLTSAGPKLPEEYRRLFMKMPMKGMSGEQLFDSLVQATGYKLETPMDGSRRSFYYGMDARGQFIAKFSNDSDKPTESQTSILQALALMNGKISADVTDLEKSETLAAVVDAPFMDEADKVEALYLATLSRPPRADEESRFVEYVRTGGPSGDSRKALADVFWVLLNSSEFRLNH